MLVATSVRGELTTMSSASTTMEYFLTRNFPPHSCKLVITRDRAGNSHKTTHSSSSKSSREIDDGIGPDKSLFIRNKDLSENKAPIANGIVPVNLLTWSHLRQQSLPSKCSSQQWFLQLSKRRCVGNMCRDCPRKLVEMKRSVGREAVT